MIKFIIITILFRFLLGMFIKKSMRNGTFFTNMHQQQRPQPNGHSNGRAKADVKIDYIPNQPDRKSFDGGEYVDYEEVK